MPSVFTTAGLALLAARRQTNTPVIVDSVQVGSLAAGARYNATADRTALVDTSPRTYSGNAIRFVVTQAQVQYDVDLAADTVTFGYSEAGFFVGNTLLVIRADQSGDFGSQAANTPGLLSLAFSIGNTGVPANLSITVSGNRIATQSEALAGTGTGLMTADLTGQAIRELSPTSSVTTYSSNDTWTKPAGLRYVRVEAVGNGRPGQWGRGGGQRPIGGSGGGYAERWIEAIDLPASVPVTVPQAIQPSATALTDGPAKSSASFGSFVVSPTTDKRLPRGTGDILDYQNTNDYGGISSGTPALINCNRGAGGGGEANISTAGSGGTSNLSGYGGDGKRDGTNGEDGHSPGGGGGAAWHATSNTIRGGAGARGEVRVFEFF